MYTIKRIYIYIRDKIYTRNSGMLSRCVASLQLPMCVCVCTTNV